MTKHFDYGNDTGYKRGLFRQIGYLADDENSLKKLLAYTKKLVTKKKEAEEEPVQTKEEILADFAEACRELKLHKEGKVELQTWEEFKKELQDEGYYN